MKFTITQEFDMGSQHKALIVQTLSDSLKTYFELKSYGEGVLTHFIGCCCIKTKEGYEDWYKPRKPKYIDYKKTISRITGQEMEIIKTFSYDIRFDYEIYDRFVSVSDDESMKMLAIAILDSLKNLETLPKKVSFDKEKYKMDMKQYFIENNIL